MRNGNPAFLASLANAGVDGLIPRRFIWVRANTRDTPPVPFAMGFWTGDDDVTVNVVDGETGTVVTRTYYGMGASLTIPKIPRTTDMTIQNVVVKLSQINELVQILVREHNVRMATVDIHEGLLSPATNTLTSNPEIAMLGQVDGDPIDTPEVGGEGGIDLEIVSDAIRSLTISNPARRSYETQNRRGGDQFSLHSNLVRNIEVFWGDLPPGETNQYNSAGKILNAMKGSR